MPLTELIRYFNTSDLAGESTLYPEGERIAAWHQGLRLRSLFQPIVAATEGRVIGHQAFLSVSDENGVTLSADASYERQPDAAAVVHFDRLCRTLHALNFLAQRQRTGGHLQLSVHPRHLQAVQNQHGLVFEAILRRCGLAPDDIVLELTQGDADASWQAAADNYRQRGYRLALAGHTLGGSNYPADIYKGPLSDLPATVAADSLLLASGIRHPRDVEAAVQRGVHWLQGPLFGTAQADCLATHSQAGLAYNAATFIPEAA